MLVGLAVLVANESAYDGHRTLHRDHTYPQMVLLGLWGSALLLWAARKSVSRLRSGSRRQVRAADVETVAEAEESEAEPKPVDSNEEEARRSSRSGGMRRPTPALDDVLGNTVLLGLIMMYFYLCDYRKIFPVQNRTYNRDVFLFLIISLSLLSLFLTLKPTEEKILSSIFSPVTLTAPYVEHLPLLSDRDHYHDQDANFNLQLFFVHQQEPALRENMWLRHLKMVFHRRQKLLGNFKDRIKNGYENL